MFSAAAGEAGAAILTVLTTIIMIKVLGDTDYSTFVLAQSYMYIVDGIINFQSWAAVIKFGSERIADNDDSGLESIIKLGTIVDFSTALAGIVVALVIAPPIGRYLGWSDQLVACSAFFSLEIIFHFSGTAVGVLRLFNHFNLVAIQRIAVGLLKFVTVIVFYVIGVEDLFLFVIVCTVADVVGHIILTGMSISIIKKHEKITILGIIKAPTKEYDIRFWKFAFWSNLATSVDIPVKQFDVFIMSTISYDMVAVYKIYKQIGNILVELSVPISQSIMPQFSDLVARKKMRSCYDVMKKLHKTIIIVMTPCMIVITIISPGLLTFIFGEIYGKYFYILSLYLLIRSYALSYAPVHQLLTSLGLVKEDFIITCVSNIAYLALALLLSKSFDILGIVMALGTQVILSINIKKKVIQKIIQTSEA